MNSVKLAEVLINDLVKLGVHHYFGVVGGASLHLIHAVNNNPLASFFPFHHEQGAVMAADGFFRETGSLACAIATSGPGVTNLITGICGAYYDSIPLVILAGQVATFRMVGETECRQIGFQETPFVDMVRPVTKLASTLAATDDLATVLRENISVALNGRPGPVVLEVPDDMQRLMLDLRHTEFRENMKARSAVTVGSLDIGSDLVRQMMAMLRSGKRPLLVAGWGLGLSHTHREFIDFAERYQIPFVCTWGIADRFDGLHPLNLGVFGTHGNRVGNFAIRYADTLLSFGSRLDTKATGTPISDFVPDGRVVMIDIDRKEIEKFDHFDRKVDLAICQDLKVVFKQIQKWEENNCDEPLATSGYDVWLHSLKMVSAKIEPFERANRESYSPSVNPYEFFFKLSSGCSGGVGRSYYVDTGCAIAWVMQSFQFNGVDRVIHDNNNTAMGWALPASLGGWFGVRSPKSDSKRVICIIGDGSLMMTLQELASIRSSGAPIKIILVNNQGYSMIKQTQDQWFGSEYVGSDFKSSSLHFPAFQKIAEAFGFDYLMVGDTSENTVSAVNLAIENDSRASFIELMVSPSARVIPQARFGKRNHDMEPQLDSQAFDALNALFN